MIENAYALVQFFNCCFEVFMYYDFLKAFFSVREERKKVIAAEIVGIASAIYLINSFQMIGLNLIGNLILYFGFTCLVFVMPLRYKVLYTTFFLAAMIIIEFFFEFMYSIIGLNIWNPGLLELCLSEIERIADFIFLQFIKKKRRGRNESDGYQYQKLLLVAPVATMILLNGVLFTEKHPEGDLLLCLGVILLVVAIVIEFGIVERLTEISSKTKNMEMLLMKGDLEQKHYKQIEQLNQEYAKYLHDVSHVFRTIHSLAEGNETSRIQALAREAGEKSCNWKSKVYNQRPILNAILCEREGMALKMGISIRMDVEIDLDTEFISDLDLICMLGNLLDNAIEAAGPIGGIIKVSAYMVNDVLLAFKVENTFQKKPRKENGHFLTAKDNPRKHGFGIQNVKEIAEQYDGDLVFEEEGEFFTATLLLSNMAKVAKIGK